MFMKSKLLFMEYLYERPMPGGLFLPIKQQKGGKKAMAETIEKHIFFLDDEPTVREVVRETLEDSNFKVSCFDSPFECLTRLRSKKCDLLITDLKMPEKDGIELLKDVKHLAPWVPVLMITGYGA